MDQTGKLKLKTKLGSLESGISILDAGAGEAQYKSYCGHLKYTSKILQNTMAKETGLAYIQKQEITVKLIS